MTFDEWWKDHSFYKGRVVQSTEGMLKLEAERAWNAARLEILSELAQSALVAFLNKEILLRKSRV